MDRIIINDEECREIAGFERYHISESGRIYRTSTGKPRSWRTKGRAYINEHKIHFRVQKNKLRQGQASLTDTTGKLHNILVSPLVALAFGVIDEKLNKKKQEIGYKDGNVKNLHYKNLFVKKREWSNGKLSQEDVKHIKKQIKQGLPLKTIAWVFGVSEMQINRIKTGENWGNGRRKIKAPVAPFKISDGKMRRYIATFDRKKTAKGIKKPFVVKRNPDKPTDNLIVGIINGYKLSLKHTSITRARKSAEKLNKFFFDKNNNNENKILPDSLHSSKGYS